jgi:hypothetical protein
LSNRDTKQQHLPLAERECHRLAAAQVDAVEVPSTGLAGLTHDLFAAVAPASAECLDLLVGELEVP